MSQPLNRGHYDLALANIAAGKWSVDAANGLIYGRLGRRIGFARATGGYPLVGITQDSKTRVIYLHRVIYEAVHGATPPGIEINHINGNKADCRISNLEAVTPSQNMEHAIRTGLYRLILSPEQVGAIRTRFAAGEDRRSLAKVYGVRPSTISDVAYGRRGRYGTKPAIPCPRKAA